MGTQQGFAGKTCSWAQEGIAQEVTGPSWADAGLLWGGRGLGAFRPFLAPALQLAVQPLHALCGRLPQRLH